MKAFKNGKITKNLNLLTYIILIIFYILFFIQFDILRNRYIKDLVYVAQYGKMEFKISSIYSNVIYYGADVDFIVYTILFNIFIFIPFGLLSNKNKSILKNMIVLTILYELLKMFVHISELNVDIILLHIIGLFIGYNVDASIKRNNRLTEYYKGSIIVIFIILISIFIKFKMIDEFTLFLPNQSIQEFFVDADKITTKEVKDSWGDVYNDYVKYMEACRSNYIIKGEFQGIDFKEKEIKIKISDQIYIKRYEKNMVFFLKYKLGSSSKKVNIDNSINTILKERKTIEGKYKYNEKIAMLASSGSLVTLVINSETGYIDFLCIENDVYKSEVNKF